MRFRLTLRNSIPVPGSPAEITVVLAEGERCLIGRTSTNQVVCHTGACSRQHCSIEASAGGLQLRDSGSTGGTWLDGKKIRQAPVAEGAVIHAGQARIDVLRVEVID